MLAVLIVVPVSFIIVAFGGCLWCLIGFVLCMGICVITFSLWLYVTVGT